MCVRAPRTGDHEDDGGGGEDGGGHEQELVEDVEPRHVVVDAHGLAPGRQQVHHVGQGGGGPAPPLVEELVEGFRGKGQGVGPCAVVDAVTLLQEQGA